MTNIKIKINNPESKGVIVTLVLVFGAIFLVIIAGLMGFILMQMRQSEEKAAWNDSLHIAEAGINYYRWCLNNGVQSNCQMTRDYLDPSGNIIGKFSLQVNPTINCGQTNEVSIVSTGWTNKFSQVTRQISVLYARESVGKFAYVLNSNVWIGADHQIRGPYHSNGGIRMDGENQSLITSAQQEWTCTSSFGCGSCPTSKGCRVSSGSCICPGVFTTTTNANSDLFDYPIPPFDFTGITVDLAQMKSSAQNGGGVYLQPSKNINSNGKGYHLKFISDGTVQAWIITGLSSTYAYSIEEGWHYDKFTITNEYLYNTYTINSGCSVIFVEDNLWPEGSIKGKVTVASANLIDSNIDTDVVLVGNLTYAVGDGTDGLALVAERNMLIGPQSPDDMTLKGIFVAQTGRFGRNHYDGNFRDNLYIYGSVISNGRVGTQWTSGSHIVSGYTNRETYFDSDLVYSPPGFVPYVDPDFININWQETR